MLACTSPQYAPWPRGSSMSCMTITRGPGLAATCSHQANSLARWPSTGWGSARISAVTAYPTIAGCFGNRQTMSEDTKPVFHGFTLKVSIALAMVGEEMRDSSVSTWGSSAVMRPPLSVCVRAVQIVCWRRCRRTSRIRSRAASTWMSVGSTARAFSKYSAALGRSSFWR